VILSSCTDTNHLQTPTPSVDETVAYLHQRIIGWSWQDDDGSYVYDNVTFNNCTLTITERVRGRDGRASNLSHVYPLGKLTEIEWYAGLLPAGSLLVAGNGIRLHWSGEAAPRYSNQDYLTLPPEFGDRIARAIQRLDKACAGRPDPDPFKR
jgi:hypothetical protein